VGSAFAGVVAAHSIRTALFVAVVMCLAATIFAVFLVPSKA